jgi:RNA polymerase sigma-70 factor (ECF subfamily)
MHPGSQSPIRLPRAAPCRILVDPGENDDLLLRTFNETRDDLVSALRLLLGNRDDAQEIAQEAFLRCWRSREGLGRVENLRGWIFRVGFNAAKDLQRSAWRRRVHAPLGTADLYRPDPDTVGQELERRESLLQVREALRRLRPEEKEVFLFRQNSGLTYLQIAALLRRPVGTVKTQMHSALQKLRKALA